MGKPASTADHRGMKWLSVARAGPGSDVRGPVAAPPAAGHAEEPAIGGVLPWVPLVAGWVACVAYAAHVGLGIGGPAAEPVLFVAAVAGAVLASAAMAANRRERPATLLFLGTAAYGASLVWFDLTPDAPAHFPSVPDLGFVAFYPLVFAAVAGVVRRQVGRLSGTLWLDSVIGALVMVALGATVVYPQLDGTFTASVASEFLFLLANLGLLGFLLTAYTLSGWRGGWTVLFMAAGAATLAAADGTYAIDLADGATSAGLLATAGWPAGMLLLTVAPYLKLQGVASASSAWVKIGIPGASAAAALPIVCLTSVTSPQNGLAALALALIVVRLMLSLHQNTRLLASVHRVAITDTLTGLANRSLLFDRLEQALALQERRGGELAVLFLDVDEFKAVNDVHGHEFGDAVLICVAERLRAAVRRHDAIAADLDAPAGPRAQHTIGRLGGDEFVVLLEGIRDPADAVAVAERIHARIRAPLVIGEHTLFLDASIGITHACATDGRGPAELLRDGDTAMYEAKRAGKHRHQVFASDMHDKLVARTELIRDLRSAVTSGQLRLLYQPQVELESGTMTGVEALVRWQHPEHGLLSPDRFIPLAESAGIIADIDDWVLRQACAQARAWDDDGLAPLDIAVNVSSRRLTTGDLAATVSDALRETGLDARRLEIEITETVAVEQDTIAVDVLARVRELGVSVAIDDFGMGHSALNRLLTFPVDRLKIDRSFVAPLTRGGERGSLVHAMIAMGQGLGLRVVAEGVETHEQLDALRALGCPTGQGYLFKRPVGAAEIELLAAAPLIAAAPDPDPAVLEGAGSGPARDRLIRSLLAELQRITGLETTYLTRIEWAAALQHITHVHNTGAIDIPEGLSVDWSDTICRRALEEGVRYTDDVPTVFPDSEAGRELGVRTYLSVPLIGPAGTVEGTLCGVSARPLRLAPEAMELMEYVAEMLARGDEGERTSDVPEAPGAVLDDEPPAGLTRRSASARR
jgi:diguanylate cyclase (GGDEF)-like protein